MRLSLAETDQTFVDSRIFAEAVKGEVIKQAAVATATAERYEEQAQAIRKLEHEVRSAGSADRFAAELTDFQSVEVRKRTHRTARRSTQ